MVTRWGLSEKLGPMTFSDDDGEVFLGRSVTQHKTVSDETAHVIDEEVRTIVSSNYSRAKVILEENIEKLHAMADALIEFETLDTDQIDDIMDGKPPRPPASWDSSESDDDNSAAGERSDTSEEDPTTDRKDGIGGPANSH